MRAAVDVPLQVDVNEAWTAEEARESLSQLAELGGADAAKIGEEVGLPGRVESWIAKAKEFVAE